ncbi:MAG: hypothetical protein SOY69_02875, partial [Alloprevotella sp.]|nr:hypothetical protein [Alloprevotella sp.]
MTSRCVQSFPIVAHLDGENCEIGPFCYIDKNVVIGNDNCLMNSVTLLSGTRLGNHNVVFPGAVI